jgi:outer membrane protein
MKVKLAVAAVACLLAVPAAFAQTTGNPTPAAPSAPAVRIGVLNIRLAIVTTAEGKQASAELQSQFAPRQTEAQNVAKQIQDIRTRLEQGQATMPDEERARLQRQGEALTRRLNRMQQELQEDVQAAEAEVGERIGGKLMQVVDRYARENGFAVVLNVSPDTNHVIYAANAVDVTQDVIRLYDAANPIRSSAAPAQPAARPAAQPGQPKPPAQKPPQQ